MNQIKVQFIDKMGDDITIINAARVSYGNEISELQPKDIKLIEYLAVNQHMSPFEHCMLTVKITCPIPISKQIMRHRTFSYNEISRRYTDKDISTYIPERWLTQSEQNKQVGIPGLLNEESLHHVYRMAVIQAEKAYETLISMGLAREQARFVLPQGLNTEFYMTGNLRNWLHFLTLRKAKDAQYEVQEVAEGLELILRSKFPIAVKALLGEMNEEKSSSEGRVAEVEREFSDSQSEVQKVVEREQGTAETIKCNVNCGQSRRDPGPEIKNS